MMGFESLIFTWQCLNTICHFLPLGAGHVHAYERTYPTYNYKKCGPMWHALAGHGRWRQY